MDIQEKIMPFVLNYGVKILSAIIILFVGLWIIKKVTPFIEKVLTKQKVDRGLVGFIKSIVGVGLKVLLVITALGQLGVATTSFVAIIGAAGLAVGLALQGSLSNFAGGALILLFKPFVIGDVIEAQGFVGKVTDIQIFVTTLLTPENKTVIIPNGDLSNGNIVNLTKEGTLRVDLVVGISYDADIKKAKKIALDVLSKNEKVLADPAPQVTVSELADSSVNLAIRPWTNTADYWDVYFSTLEDIKYAFDKKDIGIPYPHSVVEIKNQD